jgi:MFS family permease
MNSWAPLRHRAFRYLTGGRVVSMAGNALAPIALAFAVLDLTGSTKDLGLVVGARSLTNVLLVLFGGVLADRVPRRLVLVVSSLLALLTQAAVAAVVLTGSATVGLLVVLSALNGAVSAFALPATAAMLPQTVPADLLQPANAINRLGTNASMIAGAALGGFIVATVGPGWGIAIDAATFGVAAAFFALIAVPAHRRKVAQTGAVRARPLAELREGWTEFRSRTWVWVVVLGCCFFNAAEVGAVHVIGPALADETIGRQMWGLVLATETAGMMLGAYVAMRLRVRRFLLVGIATATGGALWILALALAPVAGVLLPAAFLTGVLIEQLGVAWEVSIQEHIPADRLARVYSYDLLGSLMAVPVGQIAAGPLAEAIGAEAALLVAAAIVFLSVVGMLASRSVRTLEHTVPAVPDRADHDVAALEPARP